MTTLQRPLAGLSIGLSISESEDSGARGFPSWQINRATVQIVAALFGQGAAVVFGHDWRDDGVMEAVHEFALKMQPVVAAARQAEVQPLLQNLLPWPDEPSLPALERERLAATLRIEQAGLPAELAEQAMRREPGQGVDPYLRARGLTHLRRELTARVDARICIGGRTGGSSGRYPGIIEEALLAVEAGKPLYLVGLLGGATGQIIDVLRGAPLPGGFCAVERSRPLYAKHVDARIERDRATERDRSVDPEAVAEAFRNLGVHGLAAGNELSAQENEELFDTPSLERAIELVLQGLARIHRRRRK